MRSSVLQGIANPQLANPLAALNAGTQAAKNVFDVRGLQAQQLIGQAYLDSIDPKTGRLDPLAFQQKVKEGGAVNAMGARDAAVTGEALQTSQQKLSEAQQGQVHTAISAALLEKDDGRLSAAVLEQAQRLIDGGVPRDRVMGSLLNLSSNPAEMRRQLEVTLTGLMPPQQRQDFIYDKPFRENVGGQIVGGAQSQRGGGLTTGGGALPVGLSPEALASKVTYNDPETNQPKTTTYEEFLRANNIPIPGRGTSSGGGASGGGGGGGGPSGPNAPSTTNPPRLSTQPPPVSTGPRGGATGPNPDMVAKWDASTKQYTVDNAEAGNYQQRIFPLAQAAAILQRGNVTTGEGAEGINRAKSFLMTRLATFGLDAQTVSNSEGQELGKYMTQYVNQQGFSQKSDAALASALSGNPSMHLNTATNKDVIAAMAGMERMKQMMLTDFKAQGGEGRTRDWGDFKAKWQNEHDPRAFVVDFLDGPRRQKLIDSMKDNAAQKANFNRTLTLVEQNPGIMGLAAMPGH